MTKEEILAMEAGQELDALIAKKILGLDITHRWIYGFHYADVQKDGKRYWWCNTCEEIHFEKPDNGICPYKLREKYSTDISAAWQVVEKMNNKGWYWYGYSIGGLSGSQFTKEIPKGKADLDKILDKGIVDGNFDMPEAICKAALLTKSEAKK